MSPRDFPAFPVPWPHPNAPEPGMTMRDYFAAHAPNPPISWYCGADVTTSETLRWRWYYADTMLRLRDTT